MPVGLLTPHKFNLILFTGVMQNLPQVSKTTITLQSQQENYFSTFKLGLMSRLGEKNSKPTEPVHSDV